MAITELGDLGVLGGRYALCEVLGTGGMATVYRATDQVLGRDVAVKVLSPQFAADSDFLARFEREARDVAALSHPRIVTVFDCGFNDETPFIVMELISGQTVRQVLDAKGALPASEAVQIAAAVCEALAAAHAAGLVHRDIKPANIVLSDGEVKVLDFGIARLAGPAGGDPTKAVLGTAAYLSPEQASGRPAGKQSDLYSLGCVLFEMLTGSPPFTADSAVALAYRQVHDRPGLPSARRPGLSARVDQVTARLLAKDPAGRPASADAARASLLAAIAPDRTAVLAPFPAAPAPGRPDQRPWRRRHLAEIILGSALACTILVLAVVLLTRPTVPAAGASRSPASHPSQSTSVPPSPASPTPSPNQASPSTQAPGQAPPTARAAAALVADLEAGLTDGQVSQQAAQNMFNQLQQVLFQAGQNAQQVDQQYAQLVQVYDQYQSQGQINGTSTAQIRQALTALGTALGVP